MFKFPIINLVAFFILIFLIWNNELEDAFFNGLVTEIIIRTNPLVAIKYTLFIDSKWTDLLFVKIVNIVYQVIKNNDFTSFQ